jgi:HlyD family secretion protein
MFRAAKRFFLPMASLVFLSFGGVHAYQQTRPQPRLSPPASPPTSRFTHAVAALGTVEPQTENISVGASLPGIVVDVAVKAGQEMRAGEPLFRVDDRELQAQLTLRESDCEHARAQLRRLRSMPRPEELPEARAKVAEAEARLAERLDKYQRRKRQLYNGWTNDKELTERTQEYRIAEAQLKQAKAQLALLQAGAWAGDIEVAEQGVRQAESQIMQVKTELDRLTVRAPVDGRVLQLNVRPGEYVGATNNRGLVVLGNVEVLHLRANIDEEDIPRFQRSAPATAQLRGGMGQQFPLRLVRIEPLVVNKQSLTGEGVERIDVRVLQVVYAIDAPANALYVGQQMDVFIDAIDVASERENGLVSGSHVSAERKE